MRSVLPATFLSRANRPFAALGAVFSALLLLFLAAHVANCSLPSHHESVARIARSAERAIDAGAVRAVSHVVVAADGSGNGKQIAELQAALPALVVRPTVLVETTAIPALAGNARNTALAHRKITVLLI